MATTIGNRLVKGLLCHVPPQTRTGPDGSTRQGPWPRRSPHPCHRKDLDVPTTTVSAPPPAGTHLKLSSEPDGVLAKRVASQGLCVPRSRGTFAVSADDDPWFPLDENGAQAVKLARAACSGCPVIRECREMTRREESAIGSIHGIRGGLSAGERRSALLKRRTADSGRGDIR